MSQANQRIHWAGRRSELVLEFFRGYRQEHRYSRIQFITAGQYRLGQADMFFENRRQDYADASSRNALR